VRAETSQVSYATAFLLFAAATEGNKRANGHLPETESMQRLWQVVVSQELPSPRVMPETATGHDRTTGRKQHRLVLGFFLHVDLLNLYSTTRPTIFVS
jgi:hypothetical protein